MKPDVEFLIQAGIAALLPGMRYMIEIQERQFAECRQLLTDLQHGNPEALVRLLGSSRSNGSASIPAVELPAKKRRGRPPKTLLEAQAAEAQAQKLLPAPVEEAKGGRGNPEQRAAISRFQRGYWAAMTPEQRTEEVARRMAGGGKQGRPSKHGKYSAAKRYQRSAERVGDDYTLVGAAKELGLTSYGVKSLLVRKGIRLRKVHDPESPKRTIVGVMTPAQFEKLRKSYQSDRPVVGKKKLHPRDKEHPEHDAYRAKLRAARNRVIAAAKAAAA